MRKLRGSVAWTAGAYAVCASLFHLYTAFFGVLSPLAMRSVHLLFLLPLSFILYPATRSSPKDRPTVWDLAWAAATFGGNAYIYVHSAQFTARWIGISPVTSLQVVLGTMMVVAMIEASRRAISPWFAGTTVFFLAYLVLSPYLPGLLWYRGYPYPRLIELLYLSSQDGLYGFLTGISATILFVFILFAAFMMQTGLGRYFMDLAVRLAGRFSGGPAKVAVLSSGLYASISGSSVADSYATGSFTIPMMKRIGYSPVIAGAIEAVSSAGGSLAPPVMGAGAFVMSEIIGIPYLTIASAAIIPAILYYTGIISLVHFEGVRLGFKGVAADLVPPWRKVLGDSYLLVPFAVIVYFLLQGYAPAKAAVFSILAIVILGVIVPKNRLTPAKLWSALENGAYTATAIAVAVASSGIIVTTLTTSGLALAFGTILMHVSGGSSLVALVLVMLLVSVLGTGIPTTPSYIIGVTIAAPALALFHLAPLPVSMFVFYFAVLADVMPPVAVTAFATASIAGSDPFKTGFATPRFALAGFVVPFVFVYQTTMLTHADWLTALATFAATGLSIVAIAACLAGYLFEQMSGGHRAGIATIAMASLYLSIHAAWIGIAVMVAAFVFEWSRSMSRKAGKTAWEGAAPR